MYFYTVGYGSYEDSGNISLVHRKEYTEEEFENMVKECAKIVTEQYLYKEKEKRIKDKERLQFTLEFNDPLKVDFSDIYEKVADLLCIKYTFKKLKYTQRYSVFGWANLVGENNWEEESDEKLNKLKEYLSDIIIPETLED